MDDDLTPGEYDFVRTRGDTMGEVTLTCTLNGSPMEVTSAVAQVKASRSHTAPVVLDLDATADGGADVVIGGVEVDIDPGLYVWDLEVTTAEFPSGLTLLAGSFRVRPDVSEEEGS